jgi:hypothetical protein
MATTEKWLQQPAHPFSHFDLPTPQSTGTRRGTGLILAYTFLRFFLMVIQGRTLMIMITTGTYWLGWAGLDRIGFWFGFGLSVLGE